MLIEGDYLDGVTSKRTRARLEVFNNGGQSVRLHVSKFPDEAHQKIELDYRELRIESRLGNTPREIAFGEAQLFITDDNDAVDELIKLYAEVKSPSLIHKLETSLPLIFIAVITTVVMVWLTAVYGIPKSAEYIAFQLPEFATEKLSGSLTVLDETMFDPSELDATRRQQVRELAVPYLAAYKELHPTLEFRSGMGANAFALPGGEIVLTDDFVNLVENDNELLAVLFHELGHLQYRHLTRRALQDSMITILMLLVMGDTIDTVEFVMGVPAVMLDLTYSKAFETEADSFALEQLDRFDISVDHFASVMQRLEDFYKLPHDDDNSAEIDGEVSQQGKVISEFLSTHPSTGDRVELVEQFKRERESRQ